MKKLFCLVLFLLAFSFTFAATYWVSPTGTASWNNCRSDSPLNGTQACSVRLASISAVAGDTVNFRGGTYNGDIIIPSNSGTQRNLITFTAYNNENVILTNQFITNRTMESGAWQSMNGATVQQSAEKAWEGSYSTKFTVTGELQGIKSNTFNADSNGSFGYSYYACIYSDQQSINIYFEKGDGTGALYDKDFALVPNKWICIRTQWLNYSGNEGDKAYLAFRSPRGTYSGTWYVDNVRLHRYEQSISITGKQYIKINDFHVEAAERGFYFLNGASYNEVSNSSFTDIDSYAANDIQGNWNVEGMPSQYNWIHGNVFHDNGSVIWLMDSNTCWESGDQLRIGSAISDNSSYNLIEDNIFYHAGHASINNVSRYNTIRNNVFHNEAWIKNMYTDCPLTTQSGYFGHRNILFERPDYGDITNSGYSLVENNRVGYAGTPFNQGANGIENPTDGSIIRYNFLYGNGRTGYVFKQQIGNPSNNKIYNNTFYANGGGDTIDPAMQGAISFNCSVAGDVPAENKIKNNIFYGNIPQMLSGTCKVTEVYGLNTWAGNFEENPFFSNPSMNDKYSLTLPDLSLTQNSNAIDSGTELTIVQNSDLGYGIQLKVDDASYFQDGSWAPQGKMQGDWIAVGRIDNTAQISSINYSTNTITLTSSINRNSGDKVWLYKNSSGKIVLSGSAPDAGASEYQASCTQASDCQTKDCLSKSCTDNKCVYSTDYTKNGTSCTDNDSYSCTTNFTCQNGTCKGQNSNTICANKYFGCTSAVCNPITFPEDGCGNYSPLGCNFAQNLVLYYNLDSDLKDSSGNNNNAVCTNPGCPMKTQGIIGTAMDFNTHDIIKMNWQSNPALQDFTISAWIKMNQNAPNEPSGYNCFFMKDGSNRILLKQNYFWGAINGGFLGVDTPTESNINTWVHIAEVKDGTMAYLYRNGKQINGWTVNDIPFDFNNSTIGGDGYFFFNGIIDDFRVYNTGLSAEDINTIYSQTTGPTIPTDNVCEKYADRYTTTQLNQERLKWVRGEITLKELIIKIKIWKYCGSSV